MLDPDSFIFISSSIGSKVNLEKSPRVFSQMSREDGIMEQAMVVTFPQDDPKVCHVSFRLGVPLLMIQVASVDGGRMTFGDRHSLDLRKAGSVVADEEKVSILSRAANGQHPHLILELHMDNDEEIQAWTRALRNVLPKATKAPTSPPSKDEQEEPRIIFEIIFLLYQKCSFRQVFLIVVVVSEPFPSSEN